MQESASTAIYPAAGTGAPIAFAYATLGLLNEMHEFTEAEALDEVAEAGDVLWYLAALQREIDAVLPGQAVDVTRCVFDPADAWDQALILAGKVKKLLRGDHANIALAVKGLTPTYLVCRDNLLSMEASVEAMDYNAKKLADRADRGVIRGSGDHR